MIIFFTATSCGKKNSPAATGDRPTVTVNTDTVKEGNSDYYDNYPATITALVQVDIKPQVAGNITGVFFSGRKQVKKGQKLYTIDPQQYAGAYQQAQANVDVSKANLDKSTKKCRPLYGACKKMMPSQNKQLIMLWQI